MTTERARDRQDSAGPHELIPRPALVTEGSTPRPPDHEHRITELELGRATFEARIEKKIDDGFADIKAAVRQDRSTRWWMGRGLAVAERLAVLAFLMWNGLANTEVGQMAVRHVLGIP